MTETQEIGRPEREQPEQALAAPCGECGRERSAEVRCRDGDDRLYPRGLAFHVGRRRQRHTRCRDEPGVEPAGRVTDQVHDAAPIAHGCGHGVHQACGAQRERGGGMRLDHVDLDRHSACGAALHEEIVDVDEVAQPTEVGEAEEARDEVDVVHVVVAPARIAFKAAARRHARGSTGSRCMLPARRRPGKAAWSRS